ncbi:MAG TPA: hypothetical protein VKS60_06285 [Stellaceae bacterium]|nr:hypothetical protein [Stellaceae bacterium]
MSRTRISLYYLAGYLLVLGFAFLAAPRPTLVLLLSTGDYGDVFPRLAGMLMSGLGFTVAGIILARTEALYGATLAVRSYFLICLAAFWWFTSDPLFLVIFAIVAVGVALTLSAYLTDRGGHAAAPQSR